MNKGILISINDGLKKMYYNSDIYIDKSKSDNKYIYCYVELFNGDEKEVRIVTDYEDHDWWVQEKSNGDWNNIDIITL